MADYRGVAAAVAAVEGLLKETSSLDEEGFAGSLHIRRMQPQDLGTLTDDDPAGIGILLWRVAIAQERTAHVSRTDPTGRTFNASLPVQLSVLLIPFAPSPEVQHRILGWFLRVLADRGRLTATQLNGYLKAGEVFRDTESIEVICDPLPIAEHLALGERLKEYPLCVNYLVRLVLLDSSEELH
jgi:hypothetical protein